MTAIVLAEWLALPLRATTGEVCPVAQDSTPLPRFDRPHHPAMTPAMPTRSHGGPELPLATAFQGSMTLL